MKNEKDWDLLSQIFIQRQVCILPGKVNYEKAKYDFENGKSKYYLFPLHDEEGIGYMRLLMCEDPEGLFVDYISPWSDRMVPISLLELIKKRRVYIPAPNVPEALKSACENVGEMDLEKMFKFVRQRVYCRGMIEVMRIDDVNQSA